MTLTKQAARLVWTKRETADFLKVTERTVDRLRASGRLPAQTLGARGVRFLAADVAALLADPRRA
jgi:excisionase family DNA binding protein